MNVKLNHQRIYEFGKYRLDQGEMMLYRNDTELAVAPKAVETLLALIERRGHIVSKDELMTRIWSDTVVEESNLTRYIHVLRSTLGNQDDGNPYIETFRRRGYRFNCDVEVKETGALVSVADHSGLAHTSPEAHRAYPGTGRAGGKVVALAEWREAGESQTALGFDRAEIHLSEVAKEPTAPLKRAPLVLAVAFALILSTGLAIYFSRPSTTDVLSDRDPILVADFENRTGEEVFEPTLKQALAIQLQESSFRIFPEDRIRQTLKLMKRSADDRVDAEVAREICVRQGLKAYVRGSIAQLGQNYVITLEAVNAQTAEIISSEQAEAAGKEKVLTALSMAAVNLRVKLGESLASIEKLNTPWQLTTSSLEAFMSFVEARREARKGNWPQAIRLAREAISLDPEFASAYKYLAVYYANDGQLENAVEPATRAFELRDRVGNAEQLSIAESYYQFVTLETDKQIEALLIRKQLLPDDFQPSGALANRYYVTGEYEKAVEEALEAIQKDAVVPYTVLSRSLVAVGKYSEADQAVNDGMAAGLDDLPLYDARAESALLRHDDGQLENALRAYEKKRFAHRAIGFRALTATIRGELQAGDALFQQALAATENQNAKGWTVNYLLFQAGVRSLLKGDCSAARSNVDKALAISRWDDVLSRSAGLLARCGYDSDARKLLAELLAKRPSGTLANRLDSPMINASLQFRTGDYSAAAHSLESVPQNLRRASSFVVQYLLGKCYLKLNRGADAATQFQYIIDHPGERAFSPLGPLAYLGLARSRVATGELGEARVAYEKFLEIWQHADDDLPDLISARKEYRQLARENGWR